MSIETGRPPFDPSAHMRQIRTRQGMQDYLDVKWRIAWLRQEHPEARIITEQIEGDEQHARFKCTITTMTGITRSSGGPAFEAVSTGHGSETLQDFPDFYEKAETKAIGRACAVLGYGTDSAIDLDDGEPLDGRGAAKDERAARRENASQGPPRLQNATRHESPPPRPNAPPLSPPQRTAPPQRHIDPPIPNDVDPTAPRLSPLGRPQPSINQMIALQNLAIQKGTMIGDDWDWQQIANLVACCTQHRPDGVWTKKLIEKDVYEALNALPDVPR